MHNRRDEHCSAADGPTRCRQAARFLRRCVVPGRAGLIWSICAWRLVGAGLPAVQAVPPELLDTIPADAWVVFAADATASGGGSMATTVNGAALVLDQVRRMGLLSEANPTTRVVFDVIGSLPTITRLPHAWCLLGAQAAPLPSGGFRLAGLRGALIVRTGGGHAPLEARIQHLLNIYTNREVADFETVDEAGVVSNRLVDRRLPDWAELRWGPVQDVYVIALGPGVFEQVAATVRRDRPSLVDDDWFAAAHRRCRGAVASAEWNVRFDLIRRGLGAVMAGKPEAVVKGLGLADVRRGLWSLGTAGRAVEVHAMLARKDSDEYVPISRQLEPGAEEDLIPAEATQYEFIETSARSLVHRVRDAYLAGRSPSSQARLSDMWAQLEADCGVSVDRDLLAQLGDRIVIHDFPRPPFDLPLLRTIQVEIVGSPLAVRTSLDRLLRRCRRYIAERDWPMVKLVHDPDGVWFLQAGLYGPAVAVTDGWLVIGFSPVAVRQNLVRLEPPQPASEPAGTIPDTSGRISP
ncbi:MAG: hypothetical protein GY778_03745 [bacterium]|nr:hypothetical protein [bacterium]